MVVAVILGGVMKMPADDVVDVVAVLHSLVAAAGPVLVLGFMVLAVVVGRAVGWGGLADRYMRVGHAGCLLQATMVNTWLVLLSRRPPFSPATTMSSIRTPKRSGR